MLVRLILGLGGAVFNGEMVAAVKARVKSANKAFGSS
jgi:hypothetical protein